VTELHVHDWSPWGPSLLAVIAGVERRQRTCRGCDLTQDEPTPDVQKTPAWFGSATEAAVEAMCRVWHGPEWDGLTDLYSAEEALAAAVPHIERAIRDQLERERNQ
jgi:hypothetical protein